MNHDAKLADVANHPNRSKRSPSSGRNPTPAEILAARTTAELTQTEAAAKIGGTLRAWQDYEGGQRRMHPGLFELFLIKTGQPKPGR
jgi:DNA-binding transcriptional regulator YiaG